MLGKCIIMSQQMTSSLQKCRHQAQELNASMRAHENRKNVLSLVWEPKRQEDKLELCVSVDACEGERRHMPEIVNWKCLIRKL